MSLPTELQDLGITEVQSLDDTRYNLEMPSGFSPRNGGSSQVYRIENPDFIENEESEILRYVACKRIDLTEDWKVHVVRKEIEILRRSRVAPEISCHYPYLESEVISVPRLDNAIRLLEVIYIDSELGGTIYMILSPWVDLSLQDFITYLAGESRMREEKFSELAPWYQPGSFEIWSFFLLDCVFFLLDLQDFSVRDMEQHFSIVENMDQAPNSIQVRGYERDGEGTDGKLGRPLTAVFPNNNPTKNRREMDQIRHKDLKPDNILLWPSQDPGPSIEAVFVDFGISKIHNRFANQSSHVGTSTYRAPEQQPNHGPTLKSDIWAMGCCFTFVEALMHSGREGVRWIYDRIKDHGNDFRDHFNDINAYLDSAPTEQLPPHLESMRKKLRTLVRTRMMVADPAERYNAYQVWYTWFKIMEEVGGAEPLDVRYV